jgi:hypothetical protein
MTIIPLGTALLPCSCDLPEGFDAPSRYVSRRAGTPSLFGLAPCGVYHALSITAQAVRSYRTFSPLPRRTGAVCFLWHWPSCSLDAESPDVIRHTALRSSDFPPRKAGRSLPPPQQPCDGLLVRGIDRPVLTELALLLRRLVHQLARHLGPPHQLPRRRHLELLLRC